MFGLIEVIFENAEMGACALVWVVTPLAYYVIYRVFCGVPGSEDLPEKQS